MKARGSKICCGVSSALSVIFLALAITILVLIETSTVKHAVDNFVQEQLTLKEGHELYKQWLNPGAPMYKDFYIFNLTNPSEFEDGAKPKFDEIGPYRYREYRYKTVLNQSNGTITYVVNRTFEFVNISKLAESDVVRTINFGYVTAVHTVSGNTVLELGLQALLLVIQPKLTITTPVHDLIWNYTDTLIQALYLVKEVTHLPAPYVQLQYNNSELERTRPSIIYSGENDSKQTAQFVQWAGNKTLDIWRGDAQMLNGTEGLLFHSFLAQTETIIGFIQDVQRSFHLLSNETSSVKGIDTYRFRIADYEFHPSSDYLNPYGPNGLIYLGPTQQPVAPVYGSKPHFLDADPFLLDAVDGISPPDRSKHDTVVDIEPITGATLNVHQQLQLNVNVTKTSILFPQFHNIRTPMYFPIFYVDEHAEIDDNLKSTLNSMVFIPLTAINVSIWVLFGLLCFLSALTFLIAVNRCIHLYQLYQIRSDEQLQLLPQATED